MSGKTTTTSTVSASAKAGKGTLTKSADDELATLALANRELEDEQRALAGGSNSFISLLKANSRAADKNNAEYIKGAKPLDYVISSKKFRLGPKLDATIIGMFKVYAEVMPKERDSDMPKTVGFWMPEDAMQCPLAEGNLFDRELPGGNMLCPCHWVFLYLHDYPDIEDGLISFRSVGNRFYKELQKLVKAESTSMTELRFEISSQAVKNETYKKMDYYPKFEITGRNYRFGEDGKILVSKDSDMDMETLKEILTRSNKVHSDYKQMSLVGRRKVSVPALEGPASRPALPGPKGAKASKEAEYEDEEESESCKF